MTDIYTCIPETVKSPQDAQAYRDTLHAQLVHARHTGQREQSTYTLLPYSMEDLPGTTWRNIHTADLHTVKTIGVDRWNKPGPDPQFSMFSIGCYHPKAWNLIMRKKGLGEILLRLRFALDDHQYDMFEETWGLNDYLDAFPCVFDRI